MHGGLDHYERLVLAGVASGVLLAPGCSPPPSQLPQVGTTTDDYFTKSVDCLELLMRVRSQFRRHVTAPGDPMHRYLEVGSIVLDVSNHIVKIGERHAALTPSEFSVFHYLLEQPGQACATETLLVQALGYPPRLGNPDILRTHIRNIRRKIEVDPADPRILVNLPRVGYMVAVEMAR